MGRNFSKLTPVSLFSPQERCSHPKSYPSSSPQPFLPISLQSNLIKMCFTYYSYTLLTKCTHTRIFDVILEQKKRIKIFQRRSKPTPLWFIKKKLAIKLKIASKVTVDVGGPSRVWLKEQHVELVNQQWTAKTIQRTMHNQQSFWSINSTLIF